MPDQVRLEDVTAANWRAVTRLELAEDQKRLLASNVYSLAQSKFEPQARPRAIYAGDTLIGFIMYDLEMDDTPPQAAIYRFMIDKAYQKMGYGRAALTRTIEEIRQVPGLARISISYLKDNSVAKDFYASFGFVESDSAPDNKWGEIHAVLTL